jgi:leucyl aminopeptidase
MPRANTRPARYYYGMTVAELHTSTASALTITANVLVLGVHSTDKGPLLLSDAPEFADLRESLNSIGVTGAQDEVRRVPLSPGFSESIALVGLGNAAISTDSLRYAAGSVARQLRGAPSILIALPVTSEEDAIAILEGAAIGAYEFAEFRSGPEDSQKAPATSITVVTPTQFDNAAARATIVAEAIHTVRDLVNTPPSHLYPETFADAAEELSASADVTVEVLGDDELIEGGFGGILSVGQGSERGPRLVKVSYSPSGASQHIALVGKGITFDSGGLSLKPPASMIGMKYDMTGAATVLAVTLAAAKLRLGVKLTAWLCIAENMPSGGALRPGDVITVKGGKTVEVLNTDAEGRLVLADGLVAASEEQPDIIVDVATLTGAALVALGNRYVGVMGDDTLVAEVVAAGTGVGETLWPMPIPAELRPLLASDIADIANIKPGNTAAGMLIAAAFLKDFIGTTGEGSDESLIPWAHLDIAGPANNGGSGWGFTGKGPTGVAVRTLIALADRYSDK